MLNVTIGSAGIDAVHLREDHEHAKVYDICTTQKRCECSCQEDMLAIWPPGLIDSHEAPTLVRWGEGWHASATEGRYTIRLLLVRQTGREHEQVWP